MTEAEFKPCIIYYDEGDFSQMLLEEGPMVIGRPVVVEPLYAMDDRERLVGFQWAGSAPPALSAAHSGAEPEAWRWDQVMNEGDWQTGFTEHGEPQPSPMVRNVTPLYSRPQLGRGEEALNRALDFIESLTADPLLMGVDDIEMTLEDVQDHARIELASIRKLMSAAPPVSDREENVWQPIETGGDDASQD